MVELNDISIQIKVTRSVWQEFSLYLLLFNMYMNRVMITGREWALKELKSHSIL